jgi:hypothetical protein
MGNILIMKIEIPWSHEDIATLRKLWADGKTFTEIAHALGRTRSMIAGKRSRLNLQNRLSAEVHSKVNASRPIPAQAVRFYAPQPPQAPKVLKHPKSRPVTILEATGCRFPVKSTRRDHLFCNNTLHQGQRSNVYCLQHYEIAYKL